MCLRRWEDLEPPSSAPPPCPRWPQSPSQEGLTATCPGTRHSLLLPVLTQEFKGSKCTPVRAKSNQKPEE